MEKENIKDLSPKKHSKKILASFQLGGLLGLMTSQAITQQMQFYYQTVVQIEVGLFTIAIILFTIFNMFNDPILGYFCDKSTRFTKRWGKRFPFIIMGAVPWSLTIIFIFAAPTVAQVGQIGAFLWLLFFYCLYDGFFSLYDINRVALFPDKFREDKERKLAGFFQAILETTGILLGILIPVITVEILGGTIGWLVQGILVTVICIISLVLMIPGVSEDQELRERRAHVDGEETVHFFKGMKFALKDKNFIGYICLWVAYSTSMGILIASMPFFVDDILELPKIGEIILIGYIIAVPLTAPIWYKLSFKIGIKKVALIGSIILASMGLPLLFVPSGFTGLIWSFIVIFLAGLVDGAIISMTLPVFSSIIDSATLRTKKRQEGLYNGIFVFFSRVGITVRVVIFWIVQTFSGYDPVGENTLVELLGLRIQMSLIPMLIMFTGAFIFWKLYKITMKELEANTTRLKELGL